MSDELLLPDENSVAEMLREYNIVSTRNKMLNTENLTETEQNNSAYFKQTKAELCAIYEDLYNMEQSLCTSAYRLHSLANTTARREISLLITEIKHNTALIMECWGEISKNKLNYSPKLEMGVNYIKLLKECLISEHNIITKMLAIKSPSDKFHNIIHRQLFIGNIFNILLSL